MPVNDESVHPLALDGLRVVELGDGVAPAFAGRWLAAFGAAVTLVEPPGGHWLRRYWPSGENRQVDTGPLGAFLLAGAGSVTLDPERPPDRAALRSLLADADVFLHDLAPDGLARWGLETERLRSERPGLVQAALTPFGADGPYAGHAASSNVLLALGGYQFLTGEPGREPLMLPGFQPEYLTAFYGLIGALAGVMRRRRDGDGCAVEVPTMEALASLHQFTVSQYLGSGTIRSRHGNRWENLYPITMLPCRDGYLALGISAPDQWERFCLMLGRPELAEDPRFLTAELRHRNADALDAIILEWMKDRDADRLFREMQEQWRLPVNPHRELDEVLSDPQYQERGFWVRAEGDASGVLHPGIPARMGETGWRIRSALTPDPSPATAGEGSLQSPRSPASAHAADSGGTPQPGSRPDEAPLSRGRGRGVGGEGRSELPLAGLRVLDFTRVWSGPLCTRILADLGADVIKIDPPFQRNAPPPGPAGGDEGASRPRRQAQVFGKHARNKRSLRIDLRLPAGRELVKRLVARSDALVENFSARVMPNLGLGYEELRQSNPGLVMLSMPGYGMTGPYREYLGYGSATEAMTGLTALLGYPGEEPRVSAIAYPDAVAGLAGCASLLTALVYRQATGAGQLIDLSQLEPTTLMLGEYFLAFQMTGTRPARTGNRHPCWVPHGTYRCAGEDQWISLAVRSDEEWERFCQIAGQDTPPELSMEAGRRARREVVDALVSGWTRPRDKFEVMERLQRAGIPAGAVLNAKELLEDPHLAHRGFFVQARAADGASFPMPGTPMAFDGRRREEWHAAPLPGEHNRAILREVLGLSDGEIDALTDEGVLAGPAAPVG